MKHIPNILTLVRFVLIPGIITAIVKEQYILAFIILTISGLTDVLDGFIARKFNFITDFGKLMDPLADKATQISILATLTIVNIIPTWILIIIVIKEFAMISGASFLYGKDLVVSSKWYGKLATVLFYVAIVVSLFIRQFEELIISKTFVNSTINPLLSLDMPLYILALVCSVFSLIMYIKAFYAQGYLKGLKNKSQNINEETKIKEESK